jgi:proteasome lid subunit RPN8/RPN11
MTMWNWFKRKQRRPNLQVPSAGTILIGANVIEETVSALRRSGTPDESHEGVVYWAGRRLGPDAVVTTCIAPAAETTYGSFATSSSTNAKVVMFLAQEGLELLGQVHSHPGRFVDHSHGDNERALMPYEGLLSIVVPHYGRRGMQPLTDCGIHFFEGGAFRRLTNLEIESRFRIVSHFADLRN